MEKTNIKLREYLLLAKNFELRHRTAIRGWGTILFVLFLFIYLLFLRAPVDFPTTALVSVEKGATLDEISKNLKINHVVRSPSFFKVFVYLLGGNRKAMAGDYLFSSKISAPRVAYRLVYGKFNIDPVSITIPEGASRELMAVIFSRSLPNFDKENFIKITKDKEGYLFPDTYFFFPNVRPEQIVTEMEKTFEKRLETLRDDILKSGHTLHDILTMASILEGEAHTSDDRKIIAGVLWKRISIGMPLQVDAVFKYIIGKNTYELTTKDLAMDSPYNTYKNRGLPPGPIGSPGLDSILAAIYPKDSPYLYYLSDRDGNIYYSATFEKHKRNKVLYIN